jgi:uncharacterized Tic20 family protein
MLGKRGCTFIIAIFLFITIVITGILSLILQTIWNLFQRVDIFLALLAFLSIFAFLLWRYIIWVIAHTGQSNHNSSG